jgi:gentisate 1,2-dioxygenase
MKASLLATGREHARLEYVNKAFSDGHVSRTVAAFAELLKPGAIAAERQETANNIFHVVG